MTKFRLAASIAAEENEIRSREGMTSTVINSSDADEETIMVCFQKDEVVTK